MSVTGGSMVRRGLGLVRKSWTYQDHSADFQKSLAYAARGLEWQSSTQVSGTWTLIPPEAALVRDNCRWEGRLISLTWGPHWLCWSSSMNSSTRDAQISILLQMGATLTRIWELRVWGPKALSHTASSGALVEMREYLDPCLGQGHWGFSPSLF